MRPEGTPQLFAVRNCSFDILNLRGEQVCKILMVGRPEVGEGGIPIGRVVELFRKEAESSLAVVNDLTPRLHPNCDPLLLVLKQNAPRARSFWDTLRATTTRPRIPISPERSETVRRRQRRRHNFLSALPP